MKDNEIDPKDLMAVERATTGLLGTAISLIILGFIIEKFELFLHIIALEMKVKNSSPQLPALAHTQFYSYLGICVVFVGIALALYTYHYYVNWIEHLKKKEIDTDKNIYLFLSFFIASIGLALILTMMVL